MYCNNCGKEITEGGKFCNHCGAEAQVVQNNVNYVSDESVINKVKRNKKIILIIVAILFVIVAVMGVLTFTVFQSVDKLCEKGEYQKAYDKADEDEKLSVFIENLGAVFSNDVSELLINPDSYKLYDVYFYDDSELEYDYCLIVSGGTNRMGSMIKGYSLFECFDGVWNYYYSVDDLEIGDYEGLDDSEDVNEQVSDVIAEVGCKYFSSLAIEEGVQLDKEAVDRINTHFKEDRLSEIKLIDTD